MDRRHPSPYRWRWALTLGFLGVLYAGLSVAWGGRSNDRPPPADAKTSGW